jgi:hypothetical protein
MPVRELAPVKATDDVGADAAEPSQEASGSAQPATSTPRAPQDAAGCRGRVALSTTLATRVRVRFASGVR